MSAIAKPRRMACDRRFHSLPCYPGHAAHAAILRARYQQWKATQRPPDV